MGWFGRRERRQDSPLPPDIVSLLEMYGRSKFDLYGTGVAQGLDTSRTWMLEPDLYPVAQADPDAFVTALATAALPVGGWTVFGAARLIRELLGNEYSHPASDEIRVAGLQWLRDNGVPAALFVAPVDWEFWLEHGGKTEPWLPQRPGYHPQDAPVTDLQIGEMRKVAQIKASPDSNVVYVRRDGEHDYAVVVDAPHSDDDPRRSQFETKHAETLRDLYTEMGAGLQMLPYWCDRELAAFIPYDRPHIPVL